MVKVPERGWMVGRGVVDITPSGSPYLCGYPHVERYARSVHDPLLASAMALEAPLGPTAVFVACDLLQLPRDLLDRARARIAEALGSESHAGARPANVMISATHTHSGPIAVRLLTHDADPTVPPPDPDYLARVEDSIVAAATQAIVDRRAATLAFAVADGSGLGTNRHDPAGPANPRVPVLIARGDPDGEPLGILAVCSMHPTVLHEDSTRISGDFPGLARQWLQQHVVGPDCPLVYHMGASGNQSPRHVVRANTLDEAKRLGAMLGEAVASTFDRAEPLPATLACRSATVDLPVRPIPSVEEAQSHVSQAAAQLERLQAANAPRSEQRSAEVDWFGSQKSLALAGAADRGLLRAAVDGRVPAEVQAIRVGGKTIVAWPGEVFVEFALELIADDPNLAVVTLANGELHGYLVTAEAVAAGRYEARHSLFASPESGRKLVDTTRKLLSEMA